MVGALLKELREEKELSQKSLAEALGVSASTIGMYEQNRRNPDSEMLKLFADYFNVTVDYLLGRSDLRERNGSSVQPATSPQVETIAAHLEEKAENITPHKMKMLKRYIDDLFEDFDE